MVQPGMCCGDAAGRPSTERAPCPVTVEGTRTRGSSPPQPRELPRFPASTRTPFVGQKLFVPPLALSRERVCSREGASSAQLSSSYRPLRSVEMPAPRRLGARGLGPGFSALRSWTNQTMRNFRSLETGVISILAEIQFRSSLVLALQSSFPKTQNNKKKTQKTEKGTILLNDLYA